MRGFFYIAPVKKEIINKTIILGGAMALLNEQNSVKTKNKYFTSRVGWFCGTRVRGIK